MIMMMGRPPVLICSTVVIVVGMIVGVLTAGLVMRVIPVWRRTTNGRDIFSSS